MNTPLTPEVRLKTQLSFTRQNPENMIKKDVMMMLLLCSSPICLILTVNLPLSDVSEKLPNDEGLAGEEVSTALAGEQNGDKRIE